MIKLKLNDTITCLNDFEEKHKEFFYKGKKYKIRRYLSFWNGYVVRNEEGFDLFLSSKQLVINFNYFIFEREKKLKKLNELYKKC